MSKRIFVLLLAIVILTMNICTSTSFASVNEYDGESEISFIQMLNISVGLEDKKPTDTVSKSEFVSMVVKSLRITDGEIDNSFYDVLESDRFAREIYTAKYYGYIKGDGGAFKPADPISYNECLKIVISALGYDALAQAYGGFPTGYVILSMQLGINKGVSKGEEINFASACRLIYNFLHADMAKITKLEGKSETVTSDAGKNLLNSVWKLEKTKGVLVKAGNMTAQPGSSSSANTICVAGEEFDCLIMDAEKYLGYYCDVYYNEFNEAVALYARNTNKKITLDSQKVMSFSSPYITVADEKYEKNTTYTLDAGYSFVKNGRWINNTPSDFMFENGTLTLIDNNGDNHYDFVFAEEYDYMIVSVTDRTQDVVYDSVSGINISVKNSNEYFSQIYQGNSLTGIGSLTEGMAVRFYKSDDGKVTKLFISGNKIAGTVDENSEDYVVIDGVEYKKNSYFKKYAANIFAGFTGNFILADDGTVTYAENASKKGKKYGYFFGYHKDTGLEGVIQIKLLTENNEKAVYNMEDNIKLDGEMMKKNDARVEGKLLNEGYPKYQIIKYEINEKGNIWNIDTSDDVDFELGVHDKYAEKIDGDDNLKRYIKGKQVTALPTRKVFSPHCLVASQTPVFRVPKVLSPANDGKDANKNFGDNFFLTTNIASLSNTEYIIDSYNYNKNMEAEAIVIYDIEAAGNGSVSLVEPDERADSAMVEKIVDALDDENLVSKKIVYRQGNEFVSKIIPYDVWEELKSRNVIPKKGDIVRVSLDVTGNVNGLAIDVTYDKETKKINVINPLEDSPIYYSYVTGQAISFKNNLLVMKTNYHPTLSDSKFSPLVDALYPFYAFSTPVIIKYDSEREMVLPARAWDIKTLLQDEENATNICVSQYAHNILVIYIYE